MINLKILTMIREEINRNMPNVIFIFNRMGKFFNFEYSIFFKVSQNELTQIAEVEKVDEILFLIENEKFISIKFEIKKDFYL